MRPLKIIKKKSIFSNSYFLEVENKKYIISFFDIVSTLC